MKISVVRSALLFSFPFVFCFLLLSMGCYSEEVILKREALSPDPQAEMVPLESADGWDARLLWASEVGVWTVEPFDVIPQCAGTEVTALDDKGRCALLSLNASRVSFWQPVMDGVWLGGVAHGEIDPRVPGPELYVGGQRGNLYQVKPLPQGGFNSKVIAFFPGKEIHTLVAADLDGAQGEELYAGLITGELFRIDPPEGTGEWKTPLLHKDPGRIRDAVILPPGNSSPRSMVYASRSGRVVRLTWIQGGFKEEEIYCCPQGLARIDLGKGSPGGQVLYVVGDDGQVMRFEQKGSSGWDREVIYAGPVGGRGIACGNFDGDPEKETLALFGYSGNVEILRKDATGAWTAETVFTDLDKGHWLCTGELDDRNGTDEIVISGYSGRVILLSRPPGF